MFGRRKVAALVAEFIGTGALTLVFLSVQHSTIGVPYFIALASGLVMAMVLTVFGSASGGHANPAITIALWTARKVTTVQAALYVVMQLLGAWTAYGVYTYFVNSSLQKLGGTYNSHILVAEAVGALILGLGWAAATFRSNLTYGGRAALVGVSYTLGVLVAAVAGVGLINPAVAEGVRAWPIWGSMGWGTYVLGPVLGAVIGVNLYGLLFAGDDEVVDSEVTSVTRRDSLVVADTAAVKPVRKTRTTAAKKPAAKRGRPAKK